MGKLTLSVDDDVIRAAKRTARREKTSVSAMVTRMLRARTMIRREPDDIPPDSIVARLTGIARLPKGKTAEEVLTEALMDKYGIRK